MSRPNLYGPALTGEAPAAPSESAAIIAAEDSPDVRRVLSAFVAGRAATTLRAYLSGLRAFADWYAAERRPGTPFAALLGDVTAAYGVAHDYRAFLVREDYAPSTVNLRLATLRAFRDLARRLGLVAERLDIVGLRADPVRDARGPGTDAVATLLGRLDASKAGRRDAAVVRLLYDVALRRGEVAALDLEDFDDAKDGARVFVRQKGRRDKRPIGLPTPTRDAVREWLRLRGPEPGPLFLSLDRGHAPGRLDGSSIYRIVTRRGSGERGMRPHGLRHAGITAAARLGDGDARALMEFARHTSFDTTRRYMDAASPKRDDLAAAVARSAVR